MPCLGGSEDPGKGRAHPELARAIISMWEESKAQSHGFYNDPGYAQLAFARNELEAQAAEMGPDPWPSGIKANRAPVRNVGAGAYQHLDLK